MHIMQVTYSLLLTNHVLSAACVLSPSIGPDIARYPGGSSHHTGQKDIVWEKERTGSSNNCNWVFDGKYVIIHIFNHFLWNWNWIFSWYCAFFYFNFLLIFRILTLNEMFKKVFGSNTLAGIRWETRTYQSCQEMKYKVSLKVKCPQRSLTVGATWK